MPSPAEFDPFDPQLAADPDRYWRRIGQGPRILPAGRRAVALWRHADVKALLEEGTVKCPERALATIPTGPFREHNAAIMAFLDPPEHGPVRHAVARGFAPRLLAKLAPRIEAASSALIERLTPRADLVADYAELLPLAVIAEILGVTADESPRLRRAAAAVVGALEPGATAAAFADADGAILDLTDLLTPQLERPRAGTVFALLAESGLPFAMRLHNAIFLLNAGHETTARLIAGVGRALLLDPDLAAVPGLVEEVLRLDPPLPFVPRFLARPWEGLDEGTPVTLLIAAANRDPEIFAEPERLDPARSNASAHLSFAAGRHFCLGASLARLEAGIAARHLGSIVAGLAAGPGAARTSGRMFQGWASLPLLPREEVGSARR